MSDLVKRLYVEKKKGFDVEAQGIFDDLKNNLGTEKLIGVRVIVRYDIQGISDEDIALSKKVIFSEPPVDNVYDEKYPVSTDEFVIAIEFLPGQFDQRADSAAQCIQMLTAGNRPLINVAKLIVLRGKLKTGELEEIKKYLINPIESRLASEEKPQSLNRDFGYPDDVKSLDGFISFDDDRLKNLHGELGLAMSFNDLKTVFDYFKSEKRNPTVTEIRVLDTYWSDHCRHTTFLTELSNVEFENQPAADVMRGAYNNYLMLREEIYKDGKTDKPICLMDIATIAMKHMRKTGKLNDLDVSEEINACSIIVNADITGKSEDWLVMFKNETHNHPTEIEPFGGAATCLGGAIRDPLSGRSYVYQAMRVTGSGDPRKPAAETIKGKLPQRKITIGAAQGYSSYGNQIGLATGKVTEIYDEGYVAKRMEIGAVVGAAPRLSVIRETPSPGDIVILLGGRTGRDGCGGATGSSKSHTLESLETCGAEVQKGNAPTERKIQRLFRNPDVSRMIKRCNDFGAGGVSVAIGELADSLDIDLDKIPKKYDGLDGTELAISESQERMAIVVDADNADEFIRYASKENLEAVAVADITDTGRMRMYWRGTVICDISRAFIDTNGAKQNASAFITAPDYDNSPLKSRKGEEIDYVKHISDLKYSSQRGLAERFDSTIGAGTVLMPFGGTKQKTPSEGMVAKLPVLHGETSTVTMMAHGYDPEIMKWSPFHGGVYAILESVARIVAMGGDYRKIRLTLQEYFEKPGGDPIRWGKPLAALLGAMCVQEQLEIPAIGGKDSMSGSFMDMDVPPTLVSFALAVGSTGHIITNHLKSTKSKLVLLRPKTFGDGLPNVDSAIAIYNKVHELAQKGKVLSCSAVKAGGLAVTLFEMTLGEDIGIALDPMIDEILYDKMYGSLVLEVDAETCPCDDAVLCWEENESQCLSELFGSVPYRIIGMTLKSPYIIIGDINMLLSDLQREYSKTLETVFPVKAAEAKAFSEISYTKRAKAFSLNKTAQPRVYIPVFPGTNCEYDSARRFEVAGGIPKMQIIRNSNKYEIEESLNQMADLINNSQIIMLPGGFSAGDEPDGSGKFIAAAFRNPTVAEAVMNLLNRDGLILGICNGFQALIKLGLLPYGEIRDISDDDPTLTYNFIGRHVSRYVTTRVASVLSPWLSKVKVGEIHTVPVSHGEGRFVADDAGLKMLIDSGQVAFQYVDAYGKPAVTTEYNPNGSVAAIEGITDPAGRILGKMGHSERIGRDVAININGNKDQKIFESGVGYFR